MKVILNSIVLSVILMSNSYAGCKFPDPCDIKNKNFAALSTSKTVQKVLEKSNTDAGSVNWAWTKLFEQESIGAKRLAEKTPDTIPEGDVILPDDGLVIGIDNELFENIYDLSIRNNITYQTVFTSPLISNYSILPKKLFKYGNSYHLTCKVKTHNTTLNIDKDFTILPLETYSDLEKAFRQSLHDQHNEIEENFLHAVNYFKEGYDYNGNAEILKIKGIK